jgi:hypothetical protein
MKRLITLGVLILSANCFGQYPKWMPTELMNKSFCGEFNVTGKLLQGNMVFMDVPYELSVTEDGVQVKINPGAKFGRNEWGETIKVGYKTSKIIVKEDQYRTYYKIDLTSSNEKEDSPVFPKYTLNSLEFQISNYDGHELNREEQRKFAWGWYSDNGKPAGHSIDFSISVPSYESGGPGATFKKATVCKTFKTKKEIAEDKKQAEIREKERQEHLANEKRQQELLEQKRQEIISAIEAKIPNQITEASELWVKNENILLPLNSPSKETLAKLKNGLISHYALDTVKIDVISSSSIDNDFLKSLKQGNHSINGNLNENGDYPFSEDFKKEIRQKSLVKGKAVDVYKPFRIDFIVEVRDSILTETNYYSSNTKKPVFMAGKREFYYKASTNLTTIELKYDSSIPKGVIEVIELYKYEKRVNDFIVSESKYKISYKKAILKKEK